MSSITDDDDDGGLVDDNNNNNKNIGRRGCIVTLELAVLAGVRKKVIQ